jgi:RHS repeat-associated protein
VFLGILATALRSLSICQRVVGNKFASAPARRSLNQTPSLSPTRPTCGDGEKLSTTFTYDPSSNQTAGFGRTITYTSYNKPASITQGTRTVSFVDDTEHQRFKQVTPEGDTFYIAAFGVLAEISNPGTASAKWTDYLSVGSAKVGMRTLQVASETLTTSYFHTDHLGSISVITNEYGVVVERLSYDAWGKRRNPDGTDDVTGSLTSQTTRGFTGEEQLSVSGLVHLNGRVYDPVLARMTSADPFVTDPMNPQGWNRYSYVGNDPLAFTDPNGYSWLSSFFRTVSRAVTSVFSNSIVRSVTQIVLNVVLTPFVGPIAAAVVSAAVVTGLSGGNLGQILRAGAIAGATVFATSILGTSVLAQAAVGCGSSLASGGSCASGAAGGAVSAELAPVTGALFPNAANDLGERIGSTIVRATAGGLGSIAGGGKFENGAVTAAFAYSLALGPMQEKASDPMNAMAFAPVVGGVVLGGAYVGDILFGTSAFAAAYGIWKSCNIYNNESSESGPTDTPRGTRTIDKWGIPRGDIHDIKDGIGAGPKDWVGVTPGGDVITTGPNGEPVSNGHVDDYTKRPLRQFPRGD